MQSSSKLASPGDVAFTAQSCVNPEIVFVGVSSAVYALRMVPMVVQVSCSV